MIPTSPDRIPEELKALPQWVAFDVDDTGKRPYIPGTDFSAAPNRPRDWRTFKTAWKDVEEGRRSHVAFCFTGADPYVFIDLDDPTRREQKEIFKRLRSFSQRSVSGNGKHIICRGTFNGPGRHPADLGAGIFKENRFCVMTGAILKERSEIKEVSHNDLQAIHGWMSKGASCGANGAEEQLEDRPAELPDMTVWEMGCERFNRFRNLSNGKWQRYEEYRGDHSTADHAFLAMLCDLTECNDQVRRLFQYSGMWTEERARKKAAHGSMTSYIDRSIRKVRSRQKRDSEVAEKVHVAWPQVNGAENPVPLEIVHEEVKQTPPRGKRNLIDEMPAGLMRDIAEYSFQTSYLPLQEPSVCGAIMLMSGISGRMFMTPSKSGLNLWIICVGGTSCGKDEFQAGMKRIIHAVGKNNANIRNIFGGEIVSGPGLEATLQETPRYICYMPEFGDTFRNVANPLAAEYVKTLNRGLLNSFNSSGVAGSSEGRRKAQGSDEKTYVERPCLCLAGEATPESLYGGMTTRELQTGFLQRFMLVDVDKESWSLEENPMHAAAPPKRLLAQLDRLALMADAADQRGTYKIVPADEEAAKLLKQYKNHQRKTIMNMPDGLVKKEIINRAGLKVSRLATLSAVSADMDNPIITKEHVLWAIRFIERLDKRLLERFESGHVGSGQVKQEAEIMAAIAGILNMPKHEKLKRGFTKKMLEGPVFPHSALKEAVVNLPVFMMDRSGAVSAFDRALESLLKAGDKVLLLPQDYSAEQFGSGKTRVYTLNS